MEYTTPGQSPHLQESSHDRLVCDLAAARPFLAFVSRRYAAARRSSNIVQPGKETRALGSPALCETIWQSLGLAGTAHLGLVKAAGPGKIALVR